MNKIIYILLFFALTFPIAAQSKLKDALLFEIRKLESGGSKYSSNIVLLFYQSGRISCKTSITTPQGKKLKQNKNKCLQISQTKLSELIEIAEKPEFQTASERYRYFGRMEEGGKNLKSLSINYLGKKSSKKIMITSFTQFYQQNQIPTVLELFLQKFYQIDSQIKYIYELPKPDPRWLLP